MDNKLTGIFQILLGGALFGLIPVFVRFGQSINTSTLVFFRVFFGAFFMFLIIKVLRRKITPFKQERVKLVLWSFTTMLAIGFYFMALKLIDIAPAVLLLYSYSIFIILFSRFWLKEKIHGHTIVALVLSIVGVILILSPSGFKFQGNALGYLFALCSAFWAGLNFIIPKKYFKGYDPYSLTFYQGLWQLPVLFIFLILQPPTFSFTNMSIFAALGLFCSALSFLLVYSGSRKIHGQYVGVLMTTEVLVSILLGVLLFSEIPSPIVVVGGILLIIGYALIFLKARS